VGYTRTVAALARTLLATLLHTPLVASMVLSGPLARAAHAQENPPATTAAAETPQVLSSADFHLTFRKYTPPSNEFSPFYSWDAEMGFDVGAVRMGPHAINAVGLIQTVGTENLGSKVSVGATGYIFGFEYERSLERVALAAGIRHLSSHLTRDLDDKEDEVEAGGGHVPEVDDPAEFNIVYIRTAGTLARIPLAPEFVLIVTPIAFRFNGSPAGNVRRVYAETLWRLWQGRARALALATQHEWGSNSFNRLSLQLDLVGGTARTARFQMLVSVAPGDNLHVSPLVGAVMDGVAVGFRLNFHD
jgi:hypothetical protein